MFSNYFEELEKDLAKKPKAAKKPQGKSGKGAGKETVDLEKLKEELNKVVLSKYKVDSYKMTDSSGYTPDTIDLIAYKELYRDITGIMNGVIPCELVYGTFNVIQKLDKGSLDQLIRNIVQIKKTNRFTERDEPPPAIPAFVIAYDTDLKLPDLKTKLIDSYVSMSIDRFSEIDIIVVLNKGIVIKDHRDKRSFVALETGKDSMMWFFILMNEYLDVDKDNEFDLRNYIRHNEKYNEY